jgi:hypothetical protein
MPTIAQDTQRYTNLVKRENGAEWGQCKKVVVVNGPAATLPIGTVLGKVTATGKYKVVEANAVDGSQVAVAVTVGNAFGQALPVVLAAATDTNFLVLYRGVCAVSDKALTMGATVTAGALTTAAYEQLATAGIDVLTTI